MYKKILITTDGSDDSMQACRHGIELANTEGSEVVALYVINEAVISSAISAMAHHGTSKEDLRDLLKKSAEGTLAEVVKMGEAAGVAVEPLIREGDAAGRIVETAEIEDVDLVVVGRHGEGGRISKLMGSVAQKVLYWSEKPVMVVR